MLLKPGKFGARLVTSPGVKGGHCMDARYGVSRLPQALVFIMPLA